MSIKTGQLSAQLEHPLDGLHRLSGDVWVYLHGRPLILQRVVYLGQGVHLHVLTLVAHAACAAFTHGGRNGMELRARTAPCRMPASVATIYSRSGCCWAYWSMVAVLPFTSARANTGALHSR